MTGWISWTSKCPSAINLLVVDAYVGSSSLNKWLVSFSNGGYWAISAAPCTGQLFIEESKGVNWEYASWFVPKDNLFIFLPS